MGRTLSIRTGRPAEGDVEVLIGIILPQTVSFVNKKPDPIQPSGQGKIHGPNVTDVLTFHRLNVRQ